MTSFHTFVDAEVGAAGTSGDNSVLETSWLLQQIAKDPEAWLGKDGVIAADSGASDGGERLLNPIPNATDPLDLLFNFCLSSTRFFVEETFGRWKNRFRFLLYMSRMTHRRFVNVVYASMVLHNMLTILKDDAVDFTSGADEEWQQFFKRYRRDACPDCTRANVLHCPHQARFRNACSCSGSGASSLRDSIKESLWEELRNTTTDVDATIADLVSKATARKGK